jgi:hypothetical protein
MSTVEVAATVEKRSLAKFNFTKAAIDSLSTPDKGWIYHYDGKVQGLGIEIGSTDKKSFILYRKINAIPERLTLGGTLILRLNRPEERHLKSIRLLPTV